MHDEIITAMERWFKAHPRETKLDTCSLHMCALLGLRMGRGNLTMLRSSLWRLRYPHTLEDSSCDAFTFERKDSI